MQDGRPKAELTTFQHGCIGGVVGSIEQAIMRPTVFWKAQLQQQRFNLSIALNPKYAYRGLPVAVMSIAPVTAVQFGSSNACSKALRYARGGAGGATDADRFVSSAFAGTASAMVQSPFQLVERVLEGAEYARGGAGGATDADRFVSSAFAGTASAMVQSPFQLVEVNQQNNGGNMTNCARRVFASFGMRGLYRGGSMTVIREGIFCTSYMAVAPLVKGILLGRQPQLSDGSATLLSCVAAGTLGATLSHPADTLKTRLQGSLFTAANIRGPLEAFEELRQQGPLLPQLYKGYAPRVFRICACCYIYGRLTTFFESIVRDFWLEASFQPVAVELPCRESEEAVVRGVRHAGRDFVAPGRHAQDQAPGQPVRGGQGRRARGGLGGPAAAGPVAAPGVQGLLAPGLPHRVLHLHLQPAHGVFREPRSRFLATCVLPDGCSGAALPPRAGRPSGTRDRAVSRGRE
eukprot:CAMPEP_0198612610 /NCGR_PEP_ID=MMETSP1462-20131121/157978_1 /TAXON_ID=1333877 /ORGANISM="Brandtodinium nutriculum, Strain RCC3387" /LENGTH=461 /DNA_ID=CAMNT_0044344411 /DNA_START=1 /DNA_END=1385 /DNA_ORIENTATION=-